MIFRCEWADLEEGSKCPQENCKGHMKIAPAKNCSCNINPPCTSCVEAGYVCDTCSWKNSLYEPEEEEPVYISASRHAEGSRRNEWTSTYVANPFNSTPFTKCCEIAAINTDRCPNCKALITYHDDGLAARRREVGPGNCLMCGNKRGDPAIRGNCNC